jgi:hypothetical protein
MPRAVEGRGNVSAKYDPVACWVWDRQRHKQELVDRSGDPLMAGEESDNLERYRGVRADLATLELEQKRGGLVDRADAEAEWRDVWGHVRRVLEVIGRQCDGTCGQRIVDVIQDGISDINKRVPNGSTPDGDRSDSGGPAADDAAVG